MDISYSKEKDPNTYRSSTSFDEFYIHPYQYRRRGERRMHHQSCRHIRSMTSPTLRRNNSESILKFMVPANERFEKAADWRSYRLIH